MPRWRNKNRRRRQGGCSALFTTAEFAELGDPIRSHRKALGSADLDDPDSFGVGHEPLGDDRGLVIATGLSGSIWCGALQWIVATLEKGASQQESVVDLHPTLCFDEKGEPPRGEQGLCRPTSREEVAESLGLVADARCLFVPLLSGQVDQ